MAKMAVHFEDLEQRVFVIKVIEWDREYLEQRQWVGLSEGVSGDEALAQYKQMVIGMDDASERLYHWIDNMSILLGVSINAARYRDREWA